MAPIRNSKLFPHSERTRRALESVRDAEDRLQQMRFSLQNPNARTAEQLQRQARQLASALRGTGGRLPIERQLVQLAHSIERMAGEHARSLVSQVLNALGTPGQLLNSWLRSREGAQSLQPIRQQIEEATRLLGQFAPQLLADPVTPEQAGGRLRPDPPQHSRTIPEPVVSVGGESRGNRLPESNSPHQNVTVLPDGRWHIRAPGYDRVHAPNDPVLTGEMIRVSSSNVHSIGYEFDFDNPRKSKLIVRYLQNNRGGGGGKVGGPTYEYDGVNVELFNELRQAASKGKWIWDEIRIRGSVAGHQYPYNLSRAAQGYLPRRAIVRNGIQRLIRRERTAQFSDGREQILRSLLPNQTLGRYSPSAHRPNIGNRDRGTPNRGQPDRGRPNNGR